jgi:hypothetical protein
MVLNTSFNDNEPVVCKPEEALDCFLRRRMDVLVLGDTLIEMCGEYRQDHDHYRQGRGDSHDRVAGCAKPTICGHPIISVGA